MSDWIEELISKLYEYEPETSSDSELTHLVIELAQIVKEQQDNIERVETRIRNSNILPVLNK